MLALLFAPLSMIGGHAAMAMPAAPAAASHHEQSADASVHCAEAGESARDETRGSEEGDCLTDCAVTCSAIPALGSAMTQPPMPPALARPLALAGLVRGLHPESADPPPRTA
jgi:hypothetical protein